ncbi:hypothetical protein CBL_14348 [Carabus blaptoides fortunei]
MNGSDRYKQNETQCNQKKEFTHFSVVYFASAILPCDVCIIKQNYGIENELLKERDPSKKLIGKLNGALTIISVKTINYIRSCLLSRAINGGRHTTTMRRFDARCYALGVGADTVIALCVSDSLLDSIYIHVCACLCMYV